MLKKIILTLSFFALLFGLAAPTTFAAERPPETELLFFYSETCSHCKDAKVFLDKLTEEHPEFKVSRYEMSKNEDKVVGLYQEYDVPNGMYGMVPLFFMDDKFLLGFSSSVEKELAEKIITNCSELHEQGDPICDPDKDKKTELPIIGSVDLEKFGPLTLSVLLGTLDGFNACAMVALGFLLTILIATGTRKRVFWVGGTFIFISGLVYFFFIAAWFNIVSLFWAYKDVVNIVISLVVVTSAIFLLKDYANGIICKICRVDPAGDNIFTRTEKKLFAKMGQILNEKRSLAMMLIGVAVVAIGINTVELSCSFALPMVFTGMLKNLNLSPTSYYLHLLVYVLFYMIDDFIIFMIAVVTLKKVENSDKYLKIIKLVSGILLLALGLIMLIKPSLLVL